MKKPSGRFIGGFYGLAPFTKYSEEIPSLKLTYSNSQEATLPQLANYLSGYGIDKTFLKIKNKQEPGVTYQPGNRN